MSLLAFRAGSGAEAVGPSGRISFHFHDLCRQSGAEHNSAQAFRPILTFLIGRNQCQSAIES